MAADGSIVIETDIDNKEAQKELNKLNRQIQSLENQLNSKKMRRTPLEESFNATNAKLQEAKKSLEYLQEQQYFIQEAMKQGSAPEDYMAANDDREEVEQNLKQQKKEVEALQKEWEKAKQQLEQYDSAIADTNFKLENARIQAGGLQKEVIATSTSSSKMGIAMERAKKSMSGFATRLKGVVTSALVFTVVSQALAKFRDWMGKVIQTNSEASAAVARLRGSLLTLAQPLINILIPAFTTLVNVLTRIVSVVSRVVSSLFGTTAEQSAQAAENIYNETNAIEDVAGAAKKASKSLAAFDEINQLSDNSAGESSGGGVSGGGTAPDFSGPINDSLTGIVELFTGAALLALGAILTFSGAHILLGLGLMVLGALAIWDAVTSNPEIAAQLVQSGLDAVFKVIGPLIAVIGVILTVTGHLLLGISMIIAGASIWAVGEAASDEGDFIQNIQSRLLEAAQVIGPLIAVIGVLMVVTGRLLTGLGLIIAGIALFEFTEVADDNGATLQEKIITVLGNTAKSVGLLISVLGILLLFIPGMHAKGLGMIVAGIALFAAGELAMNWELLSTDLIQALANVAGAIGPWIAILGLVLLFVPGMQAVAIGMIVVGIALFAFSIIAPNWNFILDKIKEIWNSIKNFWNTHIAKYFTAEWWANLGKDMLNGLIGAFESGINFVLRGAGSLVNGVISLINKIPGVNIGYVDWGHVQIPRLAQGAVIPPNREFMAVLGDQRNGRNLEAPEDLIRKIVREESGGSEVVALLQAILDATKAGRKMYVDKKVLAETAKDGINDMTIAAGRPVLLY